MNSSAPKAFPDGECTIPLFDLFDGIRINGWEQERVREGESR